LFGIILISNSHLSVLAAECDNWQSAHSDWIFCDDFENGHPTCKTAEPYESDQCSLCNGWSSDCTPNFCGHAAPNNGKGATTDQAHSGVYSFNMKEPAGADSSERIDQSYTAVDPQSWLHVRYHVKIPTWTVNGSSMQDLKTLYFGPYNTSWGGAHWNDNFEIDFAIMQMQSGSIHPYYFGDGTTDRYLQICSNSQGGPSECRGYSECTCPGGGTSCSESQTICTPHGAVDSTNRTKLQSYFMDGKWHAIEVAVKRYNNVSYDYFSFKMWIDGFLQADWTDVPVAGPPASHPGAGFAMNRFEMRWGAGITPASDLNFYYDDIAIGTSYIGPRQEFADTTPPSPPSGVVVN